MKTHYKWENPGEYTPSAWLSATVAVDGAMLTVLATPKARKPWDKREKYELSFSVDDAGGFGKAFAPSLPPHDPTLSMRQDADSRIHAWSSTPEARAEVRVALIDLQKRIIGRVGELEERLAEHREALARIGGMLDVVLP